MPRLRPCATCIDKCKFTIIFEMAMKIQHFAIIHEHLSG